MIVIIIMKILIDLTCLSTSITGVQRYAACVSEEMIKIDKDNEYILLFRNKIYPSFKPYLLNKNITVRIIKSNNNVIFKLFRLPIELYKIKADAYLFLYSKGPLFFYNKNIYNTIHDLVCWDYPETMEFHQMIHSRLLNKQAAKISKKIITVSNFTKNRIIELLKIPYDKVCVTYNGVSTAIKNDSNIDFEKIKKKYNLPTKYIVTLSTIEPRKNISLLLRAFDDISSQVDYSLVIIGGKGWKTNSLINKINNNPNIHWLGYIEDVEVAEIYKHSICFVFPSLYEGFGLPPLEALSLGVPVLSSNAASLREVLRKQARYFESNNCESLKNELLKLSENINNMPKSFDKFQIENFNYNASAKKILGLINKK